MIKRKLFSLLVLLMTAATGAWASTINLANVTANTTAQNGDVLTGTLGINAKIAIADGATVTLHDVTINGTNDSSYKWAGITCEGDATIILSGTNTVKGFYSGYPGITVPKNKTLVIKGDGSLAASSNGSASAIGSAIEMDCGNIVIEGGTITATAGNFAAGIGCSYDGKCGDITIANTVTSVTATKGYSSPNSIGKGYGYNTSVGTVTIGGIVTGTISTSPYTYAPVRGITLSQTNAKVIASKTLTLTPIFTPTNAVNNTVTWTTSDATVATVDNGVVTGHQLGTATITATTDEGGFTASCTVTVIGLQEETYVRMGSYNGEYVDWFAARSNTNGWVMLCKYALTKMTFGSNSTYTESNIYKWLDADAGGTFEDELGLTATERSLVKTVNLSASNGDGTDRFIIPTRGAEQPNGSPYTKAPYIYDKSTICGAYWLREKRSATEPRVIRSSDAVVEARYSAPTNNNGVRPMFYFNIDDFADLSYTGSGTEEDPYVFEPRYNVTLSNTTPEGGTISTTATRDGITIFNAGMPNKLVAGAEVTLTATPADGYVLAGITVTSGGATVVVTGNGNTRKFTMPAADVAINATFAYFPDTAYIRMGMYNGEYVDWFAAMSNTNGWVMLCKYVLKTMKFGSNSTYTESNVYKWLDADAGGTFEDELGLTANERSLVKTVDLTSTKGDGTDRFIIPHRTGEQPNGSPFTKAPYIYDKSTICPLYWLREPRDATNIRVINSNDSVVAARYNNPGNTNGVRPLFYLDLEAFADLPHTGSGTEDDPFVFEHRYDVALNITPSAGGTVTATATRDGVTIPNVSLPNSFLAGTEITLTATPALGYKLSNITVMSGGATVAVTGEGNTRTFTMPSANVTVNIEFGDFLSTDESGAYLISSKTDWEVFCARVNGGNTYSGKTVKLTADITDGVTTRTSNGKSNPFSGTFDGQGHTLNLNINVTTGDASAAPFGYISGATIKDLHITGSETTAGMRPATIAGFAENSTISNCWSEVALSSSRGADIDGGAFVGRVEDNKSLTLNGCVFTGSITYSNAAGYEGGGMVGWTRPGATATLNNCLFAPSAITVTKYSGHYMLVGGKVRGTLNNSYYNATAAASGLAKEGKQAFSISAGENVTSVDISGDATATYDVSGITAYATGINCNGTCYAGDGEEVGLAPTHTEKQGYVLIQYTATGGGSLANPSTDSPVLTMTAANTVISAELSSTGAVALNVNGIGGTPSLMDRTFKPLTATDRILDGEKFVLSVVKDDGYDFTLTLSTGGEANGYLQEFSKEDYQSYIAYAQENNISVPLNTLLLWVTMPNTDGSDLTMTLGFQPVKTFTVLYQPQGNPEEVWCRFGMVENNKECFGYAMMLRNSQMGDASVWSMKVDAAFDPTKVAFFTSEEAAKADDAPMTTAQVSQSENWTAIGSDKYLIIGGNAKTVVASFVSDASAVPFYNSETGSYDAVQGNMGVTYQLVVLPTDGDGNVTSAGSVTMPAAPEAPEGKEFDTWRTLTGEAPNKVEIDCPVNSVVSIRDNTIFTAVWKPSTLYAVLDLYGGTGIEDLYYVNYGEQLTLGEPTRDGFAFDGWTVMESVSENGLLFGEDSPFDLSTPITANLGLTAQWKHVHRYICYKLSDFKEELPEYQKYNGSYHLAECDCNYIGLKAHDFNLSGRCACGYTKTVSPTKVTLEISYGQWANNTYTQTMAESPKTVKVNEEVFGNAPHTYGDLEFLKWQYSSNGSSWYDLTSCEFVSFVIMSDIKLRALYVNPVTVPQVELSARHYDDQAEVDGVTYTMDNVLYQMNYKLPDGYTFEDVGIRLGDNAGISYYEQKERRYSYDAATQAIATGILVAVSIYNKEPTTADFSATEKYWDTRENSVLDEMSAATLAKYMYESKPVNVEKYKPIYWEAKAPTKGMSGSMCTLPPLRFIQKNNGEHWIYGIGYLRYRKPNGKVEVIYTDALPTTRDNIPDYTVSKTGSNPVGARMEAPARMMAEGLVVTSTRRVSDNSSEDNLDMSLVFVPETQLTVYVNGEWSAQLSNSYGFGDKATISAPAVSGKTFSHWEADGQTISSSNPLIMTMNAHTTLYAVYGSSAQASPTAGFTSVTRTGDGTKISFQAIADSQASEAGIIYSTSVTNPTIGADGVTQVAAQRITSTTTEMPASILDGNNCWMLQIAPESENTVYHARVYVTIGGSTIYSDVKDVTLSDLESGISRLANIDGFEGGIEGGIKDVMKELKNSFLTLDETTDNVATLAEWDGKEGIVTLQRTLQTGNWNTFCAPFDIADPVGMGLSAVKELKSATLDGYTLMLNFGDATSIEAGKPYLVMVESTVENPSFMGVTVSETAVPFTSDYVDFIPTLGKTTITGDNAKSVLFVAAGNTLKNPAALPADMKGFRAYFLLKDASTARSFTLNMGGEETGIQLVATEAQPTGEKAQTYDLQGHKLQGHPTTKGVYIQNGKKSVVK